MGNCWRNECLLALAVTVAADCRIVLGSCGKRRENPTDQHRQPRKVAQHWAESRALMQTSAGWWTVLSTYLCWPGQLASPSDFTRAKPGCALLPALNHSHIPFPPQRPQLKTSSPILLSWVDAGSARECVGFGVCSFPERVIQRWLAGRLLQGVPVALLTHAP